MAWLFQAIVVTLCTMFITNEGFVNWCNFKPPPHPEYTVVILALGVFGGLFCFCWEVKMNRNSFLKHLSFEKMLNRNI
jgi:hypothetical protein